MNRLLAPAFEKSTDPNTTNKTHAETTTEQHTTAPCPPRHDRTARLTALETGGLNPVRRYLLLRHLTGCAACRAERERIALLSAGLRALCAAPAPPMPPLPQQETAPPPRFFDTVRGLTAPKRAALFAAVMLVASAGAVLTALPGGPVRPTAAFARVEKAMNQVTTAVWQERTYYLGKTARKLDRQHTVRVRMDPPAMLMETSAAGAATGERHLTTSRGILIYAPEGRHFIQFGDITDNEILQSFVKSELRRGFRRALIFPRDASQQKDNYTGYEPFKWRETPWEVRQTTLNGAAVLRYTRDTALYRDDSAWWRKQKPREFRETVYADPRTFLIVRREDERMDTPVGDTLTVRDNFRYNVPMPPDTFDLPAPVGQTLLVTQGMPPGRHPVKASDHDGAGNAVRLLTAARQRRDWDRYAELYDFDFAPQRTVLKNAAMARIVPAQFRRETQQPPATTKAAYREQIRKEFRAGEPYRSWRIDRVDKVEYEQTYLYTRRSESIPFPPRTPPDTFNVQASLTATTESGEAVKSGAFFTVRRIGSAFRVADIRFYDVPKSSKSVPAPRCRE